MKNQKGQTLVEMIVVIGIVVLLTTGIIAGTTASLGRTQTIQLRSKALLLAQAGIELARGLRNSNWAAFSALGSPEKTYCVGTDGAFGSPEAECMVSNIDNTFTRAITMHLTTVSGVETMKVTSMVFWADHKAHLNDPATVVQLETYLTQWR